MTPAFTASLAEPRAHGRRPFRLLALSVWTVVALAIVPWAPEVFLWWTAAGFALAISWPFVAARRRGLDASEALWGFLAYFTLAMFLRGLGVLTFVDSPYLASLGDARSSTYRELVGWVFFYCTLGLASLSAGYHSPLVRRIAEGCAERAVLLRAPWRDRRIAPVGLALLAIGGVGAFLRLDSAGGFAAAAGDPMAMGTEHAVGRYWQIAMTEFAVVGYHVLVLGAMLRRSPRLKWWWLGLGLALAVPLYLVSSSKSLLIRFFFAPALFWHLVRRPLSVRAMLAPLAGFTLLFPLFYAYRALGIGGLGDLGMYLEQTEWPLLKFFNRAYDTDSFMRVIHATELGTVPLQWGRSVLDLFVFFIPRVAWPGKPDSFGLQFADLYMPDVHWGAMTYVSPSLPGELFLNFHVAGVVVGFLLFGAALRIAHRVARSGGPGAALLYGYFFLAAIHMVEGSIAAQIEFFLTSAFPTLVAAALLRGRDPSPATTAAEAA